MSSIVTSSVWAGGCPATALARLVPTLGPAQQPLPPTLPAELLILSPREGSMAQLFPGPWQGALLPSPELSNNLQTSLHCSCPPRNLCITHSLCRVWLRDHINCGGGSKEMARGKQASEQTEKKLCCHQRL